MREIDTGQKYLVGCLAKQELLGAIANGSGAKRGPMINSAYCAVFVPGPGGLRCANPPYSSLML
jgi:hypothetical protein